MTPTLPAWLAQVKARRQSASLVDTVSFLHSAGDVPALVKIVEAQAEAMEVREHYDAFYQSVSDHEEVKRVDSALTAAIKEATDGH